MSDSVEMRTPAGNGRSEENNPPGRRTNRLRFEQYGSSQYPTASRDGRELSKNEDQDEEGSRGDGQQNLSWPSEMRRLDPAESNSSNATPTLPTAPTPGRFLPPPTAPAYPPVTFNGQVYPRNSEGLWLCTRGPCAKTYVDRASVDRHVSARHDGKNKEYSCPICNTRFLEQRLVERHQREAKNFPKCKAAWDAGLVLGSPGYVSQQGSMTLAPPRPASRHLVRPLPYGSSPTGSTSGSYGGLSLSTSNRLSPSERDFSHEVYDPLLPQDGETSWTPLGDSQNQPFHFDSHPAPLPSHAPSILEPGLMSVPGSTDPSSQSNDQQFDSPTGRLHRTDPYGLLAYHRSVVEPDFLHGFDHTRSGSPVFASAAGPAEPRSQYEASTPPQITDPLAIWNALQVSRQRKQG